MTCLFRTLIATALTAPLCFAAVAQEQAADDETEYNADMTCAEFSNLTEEDQFAAMEVMAVEIGMSEKAAGEETIAKHHAGILQLCEVSPELGAMDAFQNSDKTEYNAEMTCAEFNDLTEEDQFAAVEAMAVEIGMSEEAAGEETTGMRHADILQICEVSPELGTMDAFQNSMDNP